MSFSQELKDFMGGYQQSRANHYAALKAQQDAERLAAQEEHWDATDEYTLARADKVKAGGAGGAGKTAAKYDADVRATANKNAKDDAAAADDPLGAGADTSGPTAADVAAAKAVAGLASGGSVRRPATDPAIPVLEAKAKRTKPAPAPDPAAAAPEPAPVLPPTAADVPATPEPAAGSPSHPTTIRYYAKDADDAAVAAADAFKFTPGSKATGQDDKPGVALKEMQALVQKVDPNNEVPAHIQSVKLLRDVYNYTLAHNPKAAPGAAANVLTNIMQATQELGTMAGRAFEQGNYVDGCRFLNDACNRFPSDHEINVKYDPTYGVTYTVSKDGKVIERGAPKPNVLYEMVEGIKDGTLFVKTYADKVTDAYYAAHPDELAKLQAERKPPAQGLWDKWRGVAPDEPEVPFGRLAPADPAPGVIPATPQGNAAAPAAAAPAAPAAAAPAAAAPAAAAPAPIAVSPIPVTEHASTGTPAAISVLAGVPANEGRIFRRPAPRGTPVTNAPAAPMPAGAQGPTLRPATSEELKAIQWALSTNRSKDAIRQAIISNGIQPPPELGQ